MKYPYWLSVKCKLQNLLLSEHRPDFWGEKNLGKRPTGMMCMDCLIYPKRKKRNYKTTEQYRTRLIKKETKEILTLLRQVHSKGDMKKDTNLLESQSSVGTPQDAGIELWADSSSTQHLLELAQPNVVDEDWAVRRSLWEQQQSYWREKIMQAMCLPVLSSTEKV